MTPAANGDAGAGRPGGRRLEFLDQTALELFRTTGRGQLMQCVWVYERPVDHDALRRFQRNFFESLGGRLIERSVLPFGRPRWVRPAGPPPPMVVAAAPRPRRELMEWADGLARLPIDPERGPGWHLAVQPFTDGSTAVSVLGSHVIGDGVGALMAIVEAISGTIRDAGYDRAGSRSRPRTVLADLGQAVRDLPLTLRTAIKAARVIRDNRHDLIRAGTGQSDSGPGHHVAAPSIVIYVDLAAWDAKAESLGGNSYSLLAGFAAKLAEHLGRRRVGDGAVTLMIAVNLRESLDDDRALAMAFASAVVDPAGVTWDLSDTRTVIRQARAKVKSEPDPVIELTPLVPWLPPGAVKGIAELAFSYSQDLPVSCSNLGDLPPQLAQVDGTSADYVFVRAIDTDVTLEEMTRSHGQMVVVSARINGMISISVESYQLGAENSKAQLSMLAEKTLSEFGLTGRID